MKRIILTIGIMIVTLGGCAMPPECQNLEARYTEILKEMRENFEQRAEGKQKQRRSRLNERLKIAHENMKICKNIYQLRNPYPTTHSVMPIMITPVRR